jgi:Zn-dependent metalloprotease
MDFTTKDGDLSKFQFSNGLKTFAMHANDRKGPLFAVPALGDLGSSAMSIDIDKVSATAAARQYLQRELANNQIPQFAAPEVNGVSAEFKSLSSDVEPLTDSRIVKFRQYYNKIPVYGTLVTVEMGKNNEFISINSALGNPVDVDHLARISPQQAVEKVRQTAGYDLQPLNVTPRLVYYYDSENNRCHLAYLLEDVLKQVPEELKSHNGLPQLVDFIVDAHTGEIVMELPRTQTMADVEVMDALDELDRPRRFYVYQDGDTKTLYDRTFNVQTYDFNFQDVELQKQLLPGTYVPNPPSPWSSGAVSAHANAIEVARFLREVLHRNGLDNLGEPLISSVNCRYHSHPTDNTQKEWRNAAWIGKQMVYGQKRVGDKLRSYAAALDVVAHEICHGLTDRTARLQYQSMSGALNESYSDIFGVIISNFNEPDISAWNWEMGEELEESGIPIRDFKEPSRYNQPDNMSGYRHIAEDNGGVHLNSGIHNKAAYNLLISKLGNGSYAFTATTAIQLFYLTLIHQLSRTSGFSDSKRGILLSARSLLRNDESLDEKIALIQQSFDAVGID